MSRFGSYSSAVGCISRFLNGGADLAQVLNSHDTFEAWKGVYFTGTILPLVICIMGAFVKVPRPKDKKTEKKEQ